MPRSNAGGGGKSKKSVPGSGVVAPGYKPVRKGGKIVPKKTRPGKRSPIFGGLPKPSQQVPRATQKAGSRTVKVGQSGTPRVTRRAAKGTMAADAAGRRKAAGLGLLYKSLNREERRQETLIQALTGKKTNVELRYGSSEANKGGKATRLVGVKAVQKDNLKRSNVVAEQQKVINRQQKAVARSAREQRDINFMAKKADPSRGKTFLRRNPNAGMQTDTTTSGARTLRDISKRGNVRIVDASPKLPARGVPVAQRASTPKLQKSLVKRGGSLRMKYTAQNRLKDLGELSGKSPRQASAERELQARQRKAAEQAKRDRDPVRKVVRGVRKVQQSVADKVGLGGVARAGGGVGEEILVSGAKGVAGSAKVTSSLVPTNPNGMGAKLGKGLAPTVSKQVNKAAKNLIEDPTGVKRLKRVKGKDVVRVGEGAAKVGAIAVLIGNAATNPALAAQLLATEGMTPRAQRKTRKLIRKAQRGEKIKPSDVVNAGVSPQLSKALAATPGGVGNVVKFPIYTADVAAENPGKTIDQLVRDVADSVKSIPAGVKMATDDPLRTVQAIGKDYARRYGPLAKGDVKAFKARLRKEGVSAEIIDAASAAATIGTVTGRGLGIAARAGKLGKTAESIASERPFLAVGGGEVRAQTASKNFFRAAAQRGVDKVRLKKLVRDRKKVETYVEQGKGVRRKNPDIGTPTRQAIDANRGEVVTDAGEVYQDNVVTPLLRKGAKAELRIGRDMHRALKAWARDAKPETPAERKFVAAINEMPDPVGETTTLRLGLDATDEYSKLVVRGIDATPEIRRAKRFDVSDELLRAREARALSGRRMSDTTVPTVFDSKFFGAGRKLRKTVANIGSKWYVRIKVDQTQARRILNREIKGLSDIEKQAAYASIHYGITTPKQARGLLYKRKRQIESNRAAYAEQAGKPFWGTKDELDVIDELIQRADEAFTPRLEKAREVLIREADKAGEGNPALMGTQMVERKYGPMARLLGIRREDFKPREIPAPQKKYFRDENGSLNKFEYQKAVDDWHQAVAKENARTTFAFKRAVDRAREKEGLAKPGYFRQEKRDRDLFNQYTPGGPRAINPDRATQYLLEDLGYANTELDVFVRGVMMNIKRSANWRKVADLFDEVALPGYQNMTLSQIKDAVEQGLIDPKKFGLWNPRWYRQKVDHIDESIAAARAEYERGVDEFGNDIPNTLLDDPNAQRYIDSNNVGDLDRVNEALGFTRAGKVRRRTDYATDAPVREFADSGDFSQFLREMDGLTGDAGDFAQAGWSVVPKAALDEIMASANPSGGFARAWDVAKGKSSRILLANPVWLQFQIASNAFLTGISKTGPFNLIRAQKWWYSLTPEEKQAISPVIGVHRYYDDQTHLGSRAPNIPVAKQMFTGWNTLKNTPFWQAYLKPLNPLDLLYKADNAQNNFFRRAVFYTDAKREAYRQMGKNINTATAMQARFMDMFKLEGEADVLMKEMLKNQKSIEKHAQAVDDFLGNWLSYTNAERRYIGRAVMFYGFLRFSTKLTFYTMPINHPIISSILLKLGSMQADELKKIFGADAPVPPWEVGNWYSSDLKQRLEIARLNPFFNTYQTLLGNTQEQTFGQWDPRNLLPMLPPMVVAATYDQLSQTEGAFGGKPWTVNGSNAYIGMPSAPKANGWDRIQIFANKFLRQSPAYRELEKTGVPFLGWEPMYGKQSTDSMLIPRFRQQMQYKQKDAIKRKKERIASDKREFPGSVKQGVLSPIFPSDGRRVQKSAADYAKEQRKKQGKGGKKKKAKKVKPSFNPGTQDGPSYKGPSSDGPAF